MSTYDRDYYLTMLVVITGMNESLFSHLTDEQLKAEFYQRLKGDE